MLSRLQKSIWKSAFWCAMHDKLNLAVLLCIHSVCRWQLKGFLKGLQHSTVFWWVKLVQLFCNCETVGFISTIKRAANCCPFYLCVLCENSALSAGLCSCPCPSGSLSRVRPAPSRTMVAGFQVVDGAILGCQLVPPVSFFSPGWLQWRSLWCSGSKLHRQLVT